MSGFYRAAAVWVVLVVCLCMALTACGELRQVTASDDGGGEGVVQADNRGDVSAEVESKRTEPEINWGDDEDLLKRFDDHDGRKNNYGDYIITAQAEIYGKASIPLVLSPEHLGSDFLTELHLRDAVNERPSPPEELARVTLCVTDAGVSYQYTVYENEAIYTEQGGKTYFLGLGLPGTMFASQLSAFTVAAFEHLSEQQKKTPELPAFDPFNYQLAPDDRGNSLVHKTDFFADEYDVIIIRMDYENLSPPLLLRSSTTKARILDNLNHMVQQTPPAEGMLGGPHSVIRVFDKDHCFNYILASWQLTDCQNGLTYAIPDSVIEDVDLAVAFELVCLFEGEKNE